MSQLADMLRQGASFSGKERNCLYLNLGDSPAAEGRFACVSAASGFDFPDDARAIAVVDWDLDGDLDLWITNRTAPQVRFLRNNSSGENQFVAVRLIGNGVTTNRDGIGARVEVVLRAEPSDPPGRRLVQTLRAGEGYLGQSSKWLNFGLGTNGAIEKVVVHWPGGDREAFTGAEVGRHCDLVQGTGLAQVRPRRSQDLAIRASEQVVPKTPSEGRIRLVTPVYVPPLPMENLDGTIRPMPIRGGQARLINLWATWCGPCLVELKEFVEHRNELAAAGIEITAISVDGFQGTDTTLADVRAATERLQLPFLVGRATPELLDGLYGIRDALLAFSHPPQIPTSFLLDREGRLIAMYTGPITVAQVLADAADQDGDVVHRFQNAAPITGRVVTAPAIVDALQESEAWVHHVIGLTLAKLNTDNLYDESLRAFDAAIAIKPDSVHIRLQAAKLLLARQRLSDARRYCNDMLRVQPETAEAHALLGNIALLERDLAGAERHFLEAVRIDPHQGTAHHNLGNLFDARQEHDLAEKHYRRAIAADPYAVSSYVSLAMMHYRRQRVAEAQQLLVQAISVDPSYLEAHTNLGSIWLAQGNLVEAQRRFERAAEIDSQSALVEFSLGEIARLQNDFSAARPHYQRAWRLAESQGLGEIAQASALRLRQLVAPPR